MREVLCCHYVDIQICMYSHAYNILLLTGTSDEQAD